MISLNYRSEGQIAVDARDLFDFRENKARKKGEILMTYAWICYTNIRHDIEDVSRWIKSNLELLMNTEGYRGECAGFSS